MSIVIIGVVSVFCVVCIYCVVDISIMLVHLISKPVRRSDGRVYSTVYAVSADLGMSVSLLIPLIKSGKSYLGFTYTYVVGKK